MHLYTSNDVTVRVGEQLQLNCTVVRAVNSSEVQLLWYHGTQRFTNLTRKLSNETIQLEISHVSWSDNGTYVCREHKSNRVQPASVTVRVGGKFRMQRSLLLYRLPSCSSQHLSHLSTVLVFDF